MNYSLDTRTKCGVIVKIISILSQDQFTEALPKVKAAAKSLEYALDTE